MEPDPQGRAAAPNVARAERLAGEWIDRIRRALDADPELRRAVAAGCGWAAVGSVGRREVVAGSDVDLLLLRPSSSVEIGPQDLADADRRARQVVRETLRVSVSAGADLTQLTSEAEIACSDRIGGEHDSRALHTRRILLLTESVAVGGAPARDAVRDALFREYFARSRSKGKHMLSLVNDIVRYYRTLMVDYKAKLDAEGKAWAPRNVKLRHSRKYWFFGTAMALIAADRSAADPGESEREASRLLDESPTARLVQSADRCGVPVDAVVTCYDRFLEMYGDSARRDALERLDHAHRHTCPVFARFRESAVELHREMLAVVERLPPEWRNDLLSHFLL